MKAKKTEIVYPQRGFQLVCPHCRYEFRYERAYYDKKIAEMGEEICDIQHQLAVHNKLPYFEKMARTDWWLRAKEALTYKQQQLKELKAFRKLANEQLNSQIYATFKRIVRERVGLELYQEMLQEAIDENGGYAVQDTMKHTYSRSQHISSVTSISKL